MTLGIVLTTSLDVDVIGAVKDTHVINTPYGVVEQYLLSVGSETVVAIRRSTGSTWLPPHEVNYRANMFSFYAAGVRRVLGTNIVGSLNRDLAPGTIVVPDQFLDFTRSRPVTIFDSYGHRHLDVTDPFCPRLRTTLAASAGELGVHPVSQGTYVAVEGPRYETRAEVAAFARLGGDIVGMTCVTEAILARELGLCFASVALVSNYGAGIAEDQLDTSAMVRTARMLGGDYRNLVQRAVTNAIDAPDGNCCVPDQPPTHPSWRQLMIGLTASG